MNIVQITQKAVQDMWQMCHNCPTETGGALVGTLRTPMVLAAGSPGEKAIERSSSFTTDPEHDRNFLRRTREETKRQVGILGWWHKHPDGMDHPSGGDLLQAQALMKSLTTLGDTPLWLLVFILQPRYAAEKATFPYLITDESGDLQKIRLEVVETDGPLVQAALRQESALLATGGSLNQWIDPGFRFQNTPAGRKRLEGEKEALEKLGYQVEVRQRKDNERISFLMRKGASAFLCIFPVEYPYGMPRLYRLPQQEEVYPFAMSPTWNSDIQVVDWLRLIETGALAVTAPLAEAQPVCTGSVEQDEEPAREIAEAGSPVMRATLPGLFVAGAVGVTLGFFLRRQRR